MKQEDIHQQENGADGASAAPAAQKTEGAAAAGLLSPAATAALAQLFASLDGHDKQALLSLITRFREMAEAGRAAQMAAEEEACLCEMEGQPAFCGIRGRLQAMHGLISGVPWLQALPLRERLAAACYIDRGMQLHAPTREEKLQAVLSDPALLRALAERQATLQSATQKSTPPILSGGRAPAVVKAPPRSLSEARDEAKRYLRAK